MRTFRFSENAFLLQSFTDAKDIKECSKVEYYYYFIPHSVAPSNDRTGELRHLYSIVFECANQKKERKKFY